MPVQLTDEACDVMGFTRAGVLAWESTWVAPFASGARHAGGQLVASIRIPLHAIAASMEAELALEAAAGGD